MYTWLWRHRPRWTYSWLMHGYGGRDYTGYLPHIHRCNEPHPCPPALFIPSIRGGRVWIIGPQ